MAVAGFSLELASGALTRWQGLDLASCARHEGHVIASDGTRLYRMAGGTDDGAAIPVLVRLPATDCGAPGPKRLRAVRLEGGLEGRLTVAAGSEACPRLDGQAGPAGCPGRPGSALARLGRGQGRYWALELAGDDGAALDIGAIVLDVVMLDRREA